MKLTIKQYLFLKFKHFKQKSQFQIETEKLIKHKHKSVIGGFFGIIYNNIPHFLYKLILHSYINNINLNAF